MQQSNIEESFYTWTNIHGHAIYVSMHKWRIGGQNNTAQLSRQSFVGVKAAHDTCAMQSLHEE